MAAGAQDAAGLAGELAVERELEPGGADARVGRVAERSQRVALDRAGLAHLAREALGLGEGDGAPGAADQGLAVAGQDVAALAQCGVAGQVPAGIEPGEDEVRAPVHAGVVAVAAERQRDDAGQRAPDPGADGDGQAHHAALGVGHLAGADAGPGGGRGGGPVGGGELQRRHPSLDVGRDQVVHGAVVAAVPVLRELLGDLPLGGHVAGAHDDPDEERDRGEHEHG